MTIISSHDEFTADLTDHLRASWPGTVGWYRHLHTCLTFIAAARTGVADLPGVYFDTIATTIGHVAESAAAALTEICGDTADDHGRDDAHTSGHIADAPAAATGHLANLIRDVIGEATTADSVLDTAWHNLAVHFAAYYDTITPTHPDDDPVPLPDAA